MTTTEFKRYLTFSYYSGAIGDVAHTYEGDFDSVEDAHASLDDIDHDRCEILDLQEGAWAMFQRLSSDQSGHGYWVPVLRDDEPLWAEALDRFDS